MKEKPSRKRENEESKRKKRIQNARADRVVPEPDDEFVTVKVRHITMGLQSRKFPKTSRMAAVYDWASSLSQIQRTSQSIIWGWCKNQEKNYLTGVPI